MITYILDQIRLWLVEMLVLIALTVMLGLAFVEFSVFYFRLVSKFHHPQTVTCPLSGASALVHVAPFRSAVRRMGGNVVPRLSQCTLWPANAACGQHCARQLTHLFKT